MISYVLCLRFDILHPLAWKQVEHLEGAVLSKNRISFLTAIEIVKINIR